METKIKPELIATGEPQKITADLAPFSKAKEQVGLTVSELNKFLTISTKEGLADAMEVLQIASKVEKAIEKKRKELVEPFNSGASAINAHAKEITSGLPGAIANVKAAVLKFQREEEERAAKLKKEARIKQLEAMGLVINKEGTRYELEDVKINASSLSTEDNMWHSLILGQEFELEAQAKAKLESLKEDDVELYDLLGGDEPVIEVAKPLPAPSTAFFQPAALKGAAKVWKYEVTDPTAVPAAYLKVDEVAIGKAVRDGVREIAGVRIYQEDQLRIR